MSGKFYGVGVGPGDPELLTLKAFRCIQESDIIALPVSHPNTLEVIYQTEKSKESQSQNEKLLETCIAYQIVHTVCPEIEEKAKLFLPMPMMKEKKVLKQIHDTCAEKTMEFLRQGKEIAFITLGDPTVYSTCLYVEKRIRKAGFETEIISGIPSFCAAAAKLGISLAENMEEIHIIPASYQVEESLKLSGTKILMKTGTKMPWLKRIIKEQGVPVRMVENCGMETERIYDSVDEIPEQAGYYSLLVLKEK